MLFGSFLFGFLGARDFEARLIDEGNFAGDLYQFIKEVISHIGRVPGISLNYPSKNPRKPK
jgi:hypothetical protein